MSSKLRFEVLVTLEAYQQQYSLIQLLNPELNWLDFKQYCLEMYDDNNYTFYAVYSKNELVGLCGCWIATKFYTGKYLEIDNFIIAPAYQGKGIGAEFVDYIKGVAIANHCKMLMLDAYLVNSKAHAFYEKHGFKAKGYHFLYKI